MRIDVFSDVICPWCYLGERRLAAALSRLEGSDAIDVRWRAFQLDPAAPDEPGPVRPVLEGRYGPGAVDAMTARLREAGPEVGIEFRFDLVRRVNSLAALRLLAWADQNEGAEAAARLLDRLFRAYFTDGGDIADPSSLAAWSGEVGLDPALAADAVAAGAGAERVDADLFDAADRGVAGVPTFVIDDAWAIPGAQDIDTMTALLGRALARA